MALDRFNELFKDFHDIEVVDADTVTPSTDSDENSTPPLTDLDLLLSSSTQYADNGEKDIFSFQLPQRLTSTYTRQRPHSPEHQVSLSPRPSRSRTSSAPLIDLDILLSSTTQQTKGTRVSSSSPPRTPKHPHHRSHSPVHHPSSSPASTLRTHATAVDSGIIVRTYKLPSRSDLVSLQTITILEDLKTTVFVHGGNNNLVQINTLVNPSPRLILHGYEDQHLKMDEIVKRFHRLVEFVVELETEYKKAMLDSIRALVNRMNKVRVEGKMKRIWITFITYVKDLLKEEADKLHTFYKDHIETLCRSLVVTGCIKMNVSYETELNDFNDSFTKEHSIDKSYEGIKRQAFKVFNADMKEKWKLEDVPDDKIANKILDQHLKKLEIELATDPYVGTAEDKLVLLPPLLLRAQVFCGCRSLCLPLFHSSIQILEQIQHHTVLSISTPTGSGKSTLVPALLAADGYDLIFVAQPRRLTCSAISARVNETMDNDIASWAVSGERSKTNSNTRIMYFTDGLLKEFLQFSEDKLLYEAARSSRGVVFFVDEVHERSINIDLCLAFLSLMLRNELHHKVKVILSSATIDPTVEKTFKEHDYRKVNIPEQKPLHLVTIHKSLGENMFDLIIRLNSHCKRYEQILCFVKSTNEVHQCVDLLKLKGVQAYKLIESQSVQEQQQIIADQQIFFSTTVAQTSLTFPCLKYVIDTGLINVPIYDPKIDTTVLTKHHASKMTILQRLGRLGRTCDGEYHAYYITVHNRPVYPKPQICQSNLTDVEFSLRKSPFKNGLHYFEQYLPDAPEKEYLDSAVRRLQHLNILDHTESFTPVGNAIAQLPEFGNVAMNVSVYFGLTKFNCGQDMIRLAAFLSVLNTAGSLRTIPDRFKRSDEGDFMTLLSVMNHLKSHLNAIDDQEFLPIAHQLRRALARLTSFENFFKKASPQQCVASKISADNWPNVARSLLAGYWEHVYVSMKKLNGSNKQYYRYNISDHEHTQGKQTAAIDYTTTIDLKSNNPTVVLARDAFCGTDRRGCTLSFVGIIQPAWLNNALERNFDVTNQEREHFLSKIRSTNEFQTIAQDVANTVNSLNIELIGSAGEVLDTECFIREELQQFHKWHLVEDNELNNNPTLQMNVRNVRKNLHYFHPLIWRSLNEKQVVVKMEKADKNSIKISFNSREKDYQDIKDSFDMFVWWLRKCVAVRNEHSGVIPKFLKKRDAAIEERIARVTDSERTWDKRMMAMRDGTRESRMEVVAWVAICQFQCRLEGGFPRDWIVDHRREHPTSIEPNNWVTFNKQTKLPELTPKLIPADLDFHLPLKKYFDLERFLDEMHRYEFKVEVFEEPWRYILLFDRYTSTGPFTAEFIQPYIEITHDRIDFNVNNLYVECDYTKQLGQKIDLQAPPYFIDLDSTVADIRAHKLIMLRPEDDHMNERIKKMTARGYVLKPRRFSYMPNPLDNKTMVLTPVPAGANEYKMIEKRFKEKLPHVIIELIEQVQNPNIQRLYEAQKAQIEQNHPQRDANEMFLYHGTKSDKVDGILENGFDDRYFKNDGEFGHGAYFANDPSKSHEFTDKEEVLKVILFTKVLMGKMFVVDGNLEPSTTLMNSAKIGYDSTKGKAKTSQPEYVVYRSAQALPYYKITYIDP